MSYILTSVFLLQETESLKLVADVGSEEDNQEVGSNNLHLGDNDNNDESVATNILQLSPDSVEKVLQEIESSNEKLARVEAGHDTVEEEVAEENQGRESPGEDDLEDVGDIEETTAALKRLLNTPTKGFSQLVFNDSVPVNLNTELENLSSMEDNDYLPSLSPIKHVTNPLEEFEKQNLTLSDIPGQIKLLELSTNLREVS